MIDHDAKPGHLAHCQVCGSSHLRSIIDLGHQPLCDALLTPAQLHEPEVTYPLRLMQCEECSLAQLDYVVQGEAVYPPSYPYRAGLSWTVVAAHREMAADLVKRYGIGLVVDVGCNDGTLLNQFKAQGCSVVGVEPTDIAYFAAQSGIPVVRSGFDEEVAAMIGAKAHLITMTNVFAHMASLGKVMRGVVRLLEDTGVLVVENHYLLDILQKNQFDSIYHEHIRTYSLRSLTILFKQYGMEVFKVERMPRYGGNIRVHVGFQGKHEMHRSVADILAREDEEGLGRSAPWAAWCSRVYYNRDDFRARLREHFSLGDVVGCSAPGRASTLLNFYGLSAREIRYTGELDGSLKLGCYLPGSHIPVITNKQFIKDQPHVIVLLAWHYAAEISERLRKEGVQSKLVAPLPIFTEHSKARSFA